MTESRFQISDKRRDAILVARGDDAAEVVASFDTLMTTFDNVFRAQAEPVSAAQSMVQRPVNQPGGLGATPVQSGGGDLQPCPNGGSPHQFKQGFSQRTQKNWKAWECGDKRCDMDGKGGNRAWLR